MSQLNIVSELHIRAIRNSDFSTLQKLADSLLIENIHLSTKKLKLAEFTVDPNQIMLVAEIKGEIIGVISAGKLPSLPETSRWLELFVNLNWRKKGIGKLLLQSLMSQCDTNKEIKCLALSVKMTNKQAVRLYLKNGFIKDWNLIGFLSLTIDMHVLTD